MLKDYLKDNSGWKKYGPAIILLIIIAIWLALSFTNDFTITANDTPELTSVLIVSLIIAGFLAGWLGGLIGTGGCAILLPILDFWLGFSTPVAIGTTLFIVIFTAISGGYGHYIRGTVHLRTVAWMAPFGVVGVLLGSWLFTNVLTDRVALLRIILGLIFLLPAVRMLWEGLFPEKYAVKIENNQIEAKPFGLSGFGFLVGTLTGIGGLGGGYLLVPGLIYLFRAPIYATMGTSLLTVIPMAIIGGTIKLFGGFVALEPALIAAAGTIIGAQVGAATIKKYKPSTLKLIFGIYFLYAAIKNIFM